MRLRSRIVGLVFIHGFGTVLAIFAAWLVYAFLADWGLNVPRPVRIFHALLALALPLFFIWREFLRPLRKVPNRAGLAQLMEREYPELNELLVSAALFQQAGGNTTGDAELIAKVCREADLRAAELSPKHALDPRAPSLRLFAGLICAAIAGGMFLKMPEHASIFFDRMIGGASQWPQRTQLSIEFPNATDLDVTEGFVDVRVAHGSDVPFLVRAHGIAPEEVTLSIAGEADDEKFELNLPQGSESTYRHVLPNITQNLSFTITGGDDLDRNPTVRLTVLHPPDIEGIAVRTTPPAYTGLPEAIAFNRDVEVLAGSQVEIVVLPDPSNAVGSVRLLPENRAIELRTADFPADPVSLGSNSPDAEATAPLVRTGLGFQFAAERSLRYRFELIDDSGLTNPDPGLYAISVLEDSPPLVQLQAPARTEVETVSGGAVALRVLITDDFGLTALWWQSALTRDETDIRRGDLTPLPLSPLAQPTEPTPGYRMVAHERLEVSQFADEAGATNGSIYNLEVHATDNREPEAGLGRSANVRIRIVSTDELMRRVRDRLARVRNQAGQLSLLQTDKRQRVRDLIEAHASEDALNASDQREISSALNGERLVRGDATSLTRELASVVETILYARLDEQAGPLFEALDGRMNAASTPTAQNLTWRALVAEHGRGEFGDAGLAGNLVEILGVAFAISSDHASAAAAALERARDADLPAQLKLELETAEREQSLALTRIEDLLERLAEWDSFQSVLALTRDILDRQNNLKQRTERFATEK